MPGMPQGVEKEVINRRKSIREAQWGITIAKPLRVCYYRVAIEKQHLNERPVIHKPGNFDVAWMYFFSPILAEDCIPDCIHWGESNVGNENIVGQCLCNHAR
jgi:hypothetical protein